METTNSNEKSTSIPESKHSQKNKFSGTQKINVKNSDKIIEHLDNIIEQLDYISDLVKSSKTGNDSF